MPGRGKPLLDDAVKALNLALRCLSAREYSRVELTARLMRNFTPAAAAAAVDKCVAAGWQSDARYADMLLRHCLSCGYGPRKFAFDASRKGLERALWQQAAAAADWQQAANELLSHRCPDPAALDYQGKQKLLALLARRGFSSSQARSALNFLCSSGDNGL